MNNMNSLNDGFGIFEFTFEWERVILYNVPYMCVEPQNHKTRKSQSNKNYYKVDTPCEAFQVTLYKVHHEIS